MDDGEREWAYTPTHSHTHWNGWEQQQKKDKKWRERNSTRSWTALGRPFRVINRPEPSQLPSMNQENESYCYHIELLQGLSVMEQGRMGREEVGVGCHLLSGDCTWHSHNLNGCIGSIDWWMWMRSNPRWDGRGCVDIRWMETRRMGGLGGLGGLGQPPDGENVVGMSDVIVRVDWVAPSTTTSTSTTATTIKWRWIRKYWNAAWRRRVDNYFKFDIVFYLTFIHFFYGVQYSWDWIQFPVLPLLPDVQRRRATLSQFWQLWKPSWKQFEAVWSRLDENGGRKPSENTQI